MGLRSGKSKNRKLNRADTGRSANRRADFYDLRGESGAESEYPAGEEERYYEDDFTEDVKGGSVLGCWVSGNKLQVVGCHEFGSNGLRCLHVNGTGD